ncbi:MAG: alpha/beta fold hydrolase [Hydrogenophaga sp.]|jgi:pimeloyl-ACP methyl ester carboxylesterase|uniref:alpha/beta fold hydrolase n=1 Tax=Hydrogenophaga sp. TaxID=1904254 RepID=UPI001D66E02C|nr:alpha/beta hydrolase [Hydrogenophaga sp.]MBW0172605.1 alpha/beta hydrolase [Hydrogenophaga sp.]MBW0183767.1 alpha/beta hydrolase [Hydrogenophaga sp.]
MNRIDIHGIALEVAHIPGPTDRAPLVFLHEGLGSVAMWEQRGRNWPVEVCQSTGRAGWLYSRRGYGLSDPVVDVRGPSRWQDRWHIGRHEPDYMHQEAWHVLPHLLDALGVSRPVLIGHSDGATIALLHASKHPVSACVAIAPHVFVEDVSLQAIDRARALYERHPGELRQRLSRYHADVDNAFWQWNDVWLSTPFREFDVRAECESIAAPLLLVQGMGDEYGTMAQLEAISLAARHAQRVELPECGHSPHRDQPDALTRAVKEFLSLAP